MDAHKSNKEHIDLRVFQLKVQCNTVALETSAASTPTFANCNQWKSLALGHPFSWTVLYPSKRKRWNSFKCHFPNICQKWQSLQPNTAPENQNSCGSSQKRSPNSEGNQSMLVLHFPMARLWIQNMGFFTRHFVKESQGILSCPFGARKSYRKLLQFFFCLSFSWTQYVVPATTCSSVSSQTIF